MESHVVCANRSTMTSATATFVQAPESSSAPLRPLAHSSICLCDASMRLLKSPLAMSPPLLSMLLIGDSTHRGARYTAGRNPDTKT